MGRGRESDIEIEDGQGKGRRDGAGGEQGRVATERGRPRDREGGPRGRERTEKKSQERRQEVLPGVSKGDNAVRSSRLHEQCTEAGWRWGCPTMGLVPDIMAGIP